MFWQVFHIQFFSGEQKSPTYKYTWTDTPARPHTPTLKNHIHFPFPNLFLGQVSWVSSRSHTYFCVANNFTLTVHIHFLKHVFPLSPPNQSLAHGRLHNELPSSCFSLAKESFQTVSIHFFFIILSHLSTGVLNRASNSLQYVNRSPVRTHTFYRHRLLQ